MNLPIINPLRADQSTYITFSKSLLDFDKATVNGTKCYFTKMIALNLPEWTSGGFWIDSTIIGISGTTDPNLLIPKMIQNYLENIMRQNISADNTTPVEEIAELAFWKMLNKMGLDSTAYKATVTFLNQIFIANFYQTENNNGWGEIVGQIPNKCQLLTTAWRNVANVKDSVLCDDIETSVVYDDPGNKIYDFVGKKSVIDFANCTFDATTEQTFDFNTLLLFYTDATGIEKLHGINFIYPFAQTLTSWTLPKFTQKTNNIQTIGYQFKFNQKTVNNNASAVAVYAEQQDAYYNEFAETLSKLNSFLELKINQ